MILLGLLGVAYVIGHTVIAAASQKRRHAARR